MSEPMHEQEKRFETTASHEGIDTNVGAVVRYVGLLAALLVGTLWLVSAMLAWFAGGIPTRQADRAELSRVETRGPKVDPDQPATLRRLQREQAATLQEWKWVDREAGVARIPIDVAMQRIVTGGVSPFGVAERSPEAPSKENGDDRTSSPRGTNEEGGR